MKIIYILCKNFRQLKYINNISHGLFIKKLSLMRKKEEHRLGFNKKAILY